MKLAFILILAIILSVGIGLVVALLSFGPPQPFPFSQCMDYQLNSAPSSCSPLAPVLLVFASVLLILAVFSLTLSKRERKR